MTTFTPGWTTAGENTPDPEIGSGTLEGTADETAIRINLEFAEDTDGGVDRWIFQVPTDLGLNFWAWNPNGEARAVDAADNNQQYVALAELDRMSGRIVCMNNDSRGWSAEHPFAFSTGSTLSILLVPRGQTIPTSGE